MARDCHMPIMVGVICASAARGGEPIKEPWMADEDPQVNPPDPEATSTDDADQVSEPVSAESMAEEALQNAEQAVQTLQEETGGNEGGGRRGEPESFDLPAIEDTTLSEEEEASLSILKDVTLQVKIELGRTKMYVEDILKLNEDSVIELDKAAGDPVDIYVNERLVARGEVLVLNENFCVRISEIIDPTHVDE